MNMEELASRVAATIGESAPPRLVLDQAAQEAAVALRAGEAVDLFGLVRVRLTEPGLAGKDKGAAAIAAEPLEQLLTEPQMGDVVIVLAVEKIDRFSEVFAKRLTAPKRLALVAEGLEGVAETVKKHGVDVVIMDSDLEMGDEIRQWLKTDPDRSLISLIVVYHREESPEDLAGFHICEDEFLVEPYEMGELEKLISSELTRIKVERKYFCHEVSFQFPTQVVYQQQAADFMEKLVAHSGLSEEAQMGVVVAFREAIDNASRHGNRGREDAFIGVAYVLDQDKVTVTVEDEGPGFKTTAYLSERATDSAVEAARKRHLEGGQGGLGIMLMMKSIDKLEYNSEGNMLKLTKHLRKKAAVA